MMIPPRGTTLLAVFLASLLMSAGCLYRVQTAAPGETPEGGQAAPPVTVLATATSVPAVVAPPTEPAAPPPTPTLPLSETALPADAGAPTPTPPADPSPTSDAAPAASPAATPVATATVAATAIASPPAPDPTMPPLTTAGPAVTHTIQTGESLHGIIRDYLSAELDRAVTESEIRAGLPYLLDDPANERFRANPSVVYAGQVVTLTPLDRYLDGLAGRTPTLSPTASAG